MRVARALNLYCHLPGMGNSMAVDLHEQAVHSWSTKQPWNASHNKRAGHAVEATKVYQSMMLWDELALNPCHMFSGRLTCVVWINRDSNTLSGVLSYSRAVRAYYDGLMLAGVTIAAVIHRLDWARLLQLACASESCCA